MKTAASVACPFCSLGCQYLIQKGMDDVVYSGRTVDTLDYDESAEINRGGLCPRGHFSFESLFHPQRLSRSFYKKSGNLEPEIPEQIFSKIAANISKNGKAPFSILFDPKLSIHAIQALLDFAQSNQIYAIDFVAPEDRHLFRAMMEHPFVYPEPVTSENIKSCKTIFTIGDIFTSHPLISRHILDAKYAFKANALLHLDTRTSRTAWFANRFIQAPPHSEPAVLGLMLLHLIQKVPQNKISDEIRWLENYLNKHLPDFPGYQELSGLIKPAVSEMVSYLLRDEDKLIIFAPQLYNSAGGYIIGIITAAMSSLLGAQYIPLYNQANLSWLEKQAGNIPPEFRPGNRPVLKHILEGDFQMLLAMGFDPSTVFPGDISWPADTQLIVASMMKIQPTENTRAILALSHFFEQNDLRSSLLNKEAVQSLAVKPSLGHAKSVAFLTFNLHQKYNALQRDIENPVIAHAIPNWKVNFEAEWEFFMENIQRIGKQPGFWLLPHAHISHCGDGHYTRHSSWARNDCHDNRVRISASDASFYKLSTQKKIRLKAGSHQFEAIPEVLQNLQPGTIAAYSHYGPVRKMMEGVFGGHNQEYYTFCPKVQF